MEYSRQHVTTRMLLHLHMRQFVYLLEFSGCLFPFFPPLQQCNIAQIQIGRAKYVGFGTWNNAKAEK